MQLDDDGRSLKLPGEENKENTTSLKIHDNESDSDVPLDSNLTNFIVLPGDSITRLDKNGKTVFDKETGEQKLDTAKSEYLKTLGVKLGDIVEVEYNGKISYAILGDIGPSSKLGEGSRRLNYELGTLSKAKNRDGTLKYKHPNDEWDWQSELHTTTWKQPTMAQPGAVTYRIFPGSAKSFDNITDDQAEINRRGIILTRQNIISEPLRKSLDSHRGAGDRAP